MAPKQIERQIFLPASPREVWDALTDGKQVSEWFGAEVEIEARPGGTVHFHFPDGRKRGAVIVTFETERLLVLRWLPFEQDAEGKTEVRPSTNLRFSLQPSEDGTLLVVRETLPILSSRNPAVSDRDEDPERGLERFHFEVRVGP